MTRGTMGYGKKSRIHTTSALRLSGDLPIVIETVDAGSKLLALLPELSELVRDGLITTEPVHVARHLEDGPSSR